MAQVDRPLVDPAVKSVQTRKARYALFKIVNESSNQSTILVTVDKVSAREANYRDLLKDLKENSARFALYDYEFLSVDNRPTSSLISISWMPENVNQKERILYSSAKSNFVAILSGFKQETCENKDEIKQLLSNESFIVPTQSS